VARLPLASRIAATGFSCLLGVRKPHPGIYLHVTRRLGVAPEQCLYVGDGDSRELSGAAALGMTALRIRLPATGRPTVTRTTPTSPDPRSIAWGSSWVILAGDGGPVNARLPCAFFARPVLEVARDLLGCTFLCDGVGGRLVEVEAYRADDPASHSYRGRTPRNAVMFGPPGRLYVYFTMGLHFCVNVVCEGEGHAAAVLLRALEPTAGLEAMRRRRGLDDARRLCSGPAKLTQALAVTRADDGLVACDAEGGTGDGAADVGVADAARTPPRASPRPAEPASWP